MTEVCLVVIMLLLAVCTGFLFDVAIISRRIAVAMEKLAGGKP